MVYPWQKIHHHHLIIGDFPGPCLMTLECCFFASGGSSELDMALMSPGMSPRIARRVQKRQAGNTGEYIVPVT